MRITYYENVRLCRVNSPSEVSNEIEKTYMETWIVELHTNVYLQISMFGVTG